jgi:transposase
LQEIRIKHRWEALDAENDAIESARNKPVKYTSELLSNGNTLKQLLARSRYLLYKWSRKWTEKVRQAAFKSFSTIARTMSIHYKNILNYFDNRNTNASAEAFNAKIKAFRAQFRGVKNVEFFLYRLTTIFA